MPAGRQPRFAVEPMNSSHDRAAFSCGVPSLDNYLRAHAGQDVKRRMAAVFVLVDKESGAVAGYNTLSAAVVTLPELPAETARKLPRYPAVPATLLGRLAVSPACQGQRLGEALLFDALERSRRHSSEIASYALLVDAENEQAKAFYERYGFQTFKDRPTRLFLPL